MTFRVDQAARLLAHLTLDFSTPIGQTEWRASGSYYDSKGTLDLQLHPLSAAESTVIVPQPQIISIRPLGKAFSGVVYSLLIPRAQTTKCVRNAMQLISHKLKFVK